MSEITRAELQQLAGYRTKIAFLSAEISRLTDIINTYSGTDTVQGSSTELPYSLHSIPIKCSTAPDKLKKQLCAKRVQLRCLKRKSTQAYLNALDKVQKIKDPIVQSVIMLHYCDGLTWQQVANRIGGNNTADSVRKLCDRYLQRQH